VPPICPTFAHKSCSTPVATLPLTVKKALRPYYAITLLLSTSRTQHPNYSRDAGGPDKASTCLSLASWLTCGTPNPALATFHSGECRTRHCSRSWPPRQCLVPSHYLHDSVADSKEHQGACIAIEKPDMRDMWTSAAQIQSQPGLARLLPPSPFVVPDIHRSPTDTVHRIHHPLRVAISCSSFVSSDGVSDEAVRPQVNPSPQPA
jgi:hypothetical protein